MGTHYPVHLKSGPITSPGFTPGSSWVRRDPSRIRYILLIGAMILGLALVTTTAMGAVTRPGSAAASQAGGIFIVNDPADPGDPACSPTVCSLRAAITAANAASISGTQVIDFDLSYPLTITLSSPLPAVTGTLVISGPGAQNLVVSGDGQYRVIEVGSGASLVLGGIAIRQGYHDIRGGGIFVDNGTLTLHDSLIAGNAVGAGDGGGLHNDGGRVSIASTTFADNNAFHDGGIANSGVMTVTESLFTGNRARIGGAIENAGALTVTHTTFTKNLAPQVSGGAIQNGGTLVVANSTFFDNGSTMGADIHNINGAVYVTNSSFYSATLPSLNSIVNFTISGTVTLSNTLLAAGSGIDNCGSMMGGGPYNVSVENLATDATCGSATVVTLDQLKLGTLGDNGGSTPTVPLLPGSVAIDAGDDTACAAPVGAPSYGAGGQDQRGIARPQGAHCDVGAFEKLGLDLYLSLVLRNMP